MSPSKSKIIHQVFSGQTKNLSSQDWAELFREVIESLSLYLQNPITTDNTNTSQGGFFSNIYVENSSPLGTEWEGILTAVLDETSSNISISAIMFPYLAQKRVSPIRTNEYLLIKYTPNDPSRQGQWASQGWFRDEYDAFSFYNRYPPQLQATKPPTTANQDLCSDKRATNQNLCSRAPLPDKAL